MWNFNNGQCLSEYLGFGQDEIAAVACLHEGPNHFVAAGGWAHKVSKPRAAPQAPALRRIGSLAAPSADPRTCC
eukprot:scaffold370_cov289-Prasinococcus_capsulatus_cf.AAC.8